MDKSKKEPLIDFLKRVGNGDKKAIKEWEKIISRISDTKTYEDE